MTGNPSGKDEILSSPDPVTGVLKQLSMSRLSPLDLVPRRNLVEKLIELVLVGAPPGPPQVTACLEDMARLLSEVDTSGLNVVVFGGGTGLSNVIGGDSRNPGWKDNPFQGIKELFPRTRSIVCVTDDGGSTGELLKDLPLIAMGDLRHVMLSSIRLAKLERVYGLNRDGARRTATILHGLFNLRFAGRPSSARSLLRGENVEVDKLPHTMAENLNSLLSFLFSDDRLQSLLDRPHCLGNLLLAAAIYRRSDDDGLKVRPETVTAGIGWLADLIGANHDAVLPCTTTPAHLAIMYTNGVIVTGENKSATARRNVAVDRVFAEFVEEPEVPAEVFRLIEDADIIVFAPGSLYTSIIPILQVPGLARAVRDNSRALKILVANLWIQKGETDLVREDPRRRFYVSDLIAAYHRNIPGGVDHLFEQVMLLGLQDIPGHILQSYAVEEKVPIYLDRGRVWEMGFAPVEARIFSETALKDRRVQHDPATLARAIKTIWAVRDHIPRKVKSELPPCYRINHTVQTCRLTPDRRRAFFAGLVRDWQVEERIRGKLGDIFWNHWDILEEHVALVKGVELINKSKWQRSLHWDSVFALYDPEDSLIKICDEVAGDAARFEFAFLVALGESLLGNYAARKEVIPVEREGMRLGKIFQLTLEPEETRRSFFNQAELTRYLRLVRMIRAGDDHNVYTRLINGNEGFTPPGLLMGLIFAWYLDNRYASHIEYKMAITRIPMMDLIREQVRMLHRRMDTIDFFRKVVFRHTSPAFDEQLVV